MANSYELDEKGYGMCRCCRRKFSVSQLKSCLYCAVIDGYVKDVRLNLKEYQVHMYVKFAREMNKDGIMGYH